MSLQVRWRSWKWRWRYWCLKVMVNGWYLYSLIEDSPVHLEWFKCSPSIRQKPFATWFWCCSCRSQGKHWSHWVPCVPGFPYDASSVVCFQEGPVAEFASKHLASQWTYVTDAMRLGQGFILMVQHLCLSQQISSLYMTVYFSKNRCQASKSCWPWALRPGDERWRDSIFHDFALNLGREQVAGRLLVLNFFWINIPTSHLDDPNRFQQTVLRLDGQARDRRDLRDLWSLRRFRSASLAPAFMAALHSDPVLMAMRSLISSSDCCRIVLSS